MSQTIQPKTPNRPKNPPPANQPANFEYGMWHILRRYELDPKVQTALGNELLELVRDYLPISVRMRRTLPVRPYSTGDAVHYFSSSVSSISICSRFYRNRLPAERITTDPDKATCQHCRKKIAELPESLTAEEESASLNGGKR